MSRWLGLGVVGTLALVSCRSLPPQGLPLGSDDPRPAAFVEALLRTSEARTALRGRARVTLDGVRGASFARQIVLLERPARMRVEVMGMLGQRVAMLATDGTRYQVYRAEGPALERGDVHAGILLETLGLALAPEQAVRLALGAPLAPGEPVRPARAAALRGGAVIRVELSADEGEPRRVLDFSADGELARYVVTDPAGQTVLDARYGDYREVEGSAFAHSLELDFPGVETRAAIEFQGIELNPELPGSLFQLAPWAGSEAP